MLEAFALLRELHRLRRGRLSLAELVQRVARAEPAGRVRADAARRRPGGGEPAAIVDQARAFAAAGGGGLRAFTRWLAESTESEASEVDAGIAEETDDVVRAC